MAQSFDVTINELKFKLEGLKRNDSAHGEDVGRFERSAEISREKRKAVRDEITETESAIKLLEGAFDGKAE